MRGWVLLSMQGLTVRRTHPRERRRQAASEATVVGRGPASAVDVRMLLAVNATIPAYRVVVSVGLVTP